MNIYKVGNNYMALSQKQVENLINKRDNYDLNETKVVEELVHGNVLDIGANIGYFTIIMAKCEKVNHVYAFEPDPTNYENLSLNIRLNNLGDKVTIFNCAITNHNNTTNLYHCDFNDGMHRIYKSKWCTGTGLNVPTRTIDNLICDDDLNDPSFLSRKIDFVKLDIEGSEFGALKGMEQMLRRDKPTIIMEFHPPSIIEAGDKPRDIYDLLRNVGYEEFDLIGNDYKYYNVDYYELSRFTKNTPAMNLVCK